MTVPEIIEQLASLGTDAYKQIIMRHGVREPVFGVKIEELKKLQKQIRTDQQLALDLYETGIYDAMYLAGLIADPGKMTRAELNRWLALSTCPTLTEYTVAWITAESPHGRELAREWIESDDEDTAAAGWSALASIVSIISNDELNVPELQLLLTRVERTIHRQPDRVRYQMNGFVIATGSYVPALTDFALEVATAIGPVRVDMGRTACRVPSASEYIQKVQQRGAIGKKRKTARC